jgi:hypothetical protein
VKQTESSSLIGGWSIFKDTMRDLKSGWRVYLLIILIVTVPIRLFGLSKSLAVDGSFGALSALASFILNLALLSLATRRYKGESPTVASIYYEGTSSFVRYLVTSFLLPLYRLG